MRRFSAQVKDENLAPHPHRIELTGAPRDLAWPPLCPCCGAPAGERLEVRKIFMRHRRRKGWRRLITGARIPYCPACTARHLEECPPYTPIAYIGSMLLTPVIIAAIGAAVMGVIAARAVFENPPTGQGFLVSYGIVGFFAAAFLWSVVQMWLSTETLRVPEQTEVTLSCDFSDDLAGPLERQRRIWAIRDRGFFDAFAAANRERV